jgi:hypothetical protein
MVPSTLEREQRGPQHVRPQVRECCIVASLESCEPFDVRS